MYLKVKKSGSSSDKKVFKENVTDGQKNFKANPCELYEILTHESLSQEKLEGKFVSKFF